VPSASLTFRIQGREADASEFADAAEQLVEADTRADHPSTCSLPHAKMAGRGKRLCPKCKAPLKLEEAKDSMAKANSPEPFSSSKTSNWVARAGGLPPYIQHVAHDIHEKRGKTVSEAIRIAIGVIKNWAHGHGNVDAGTKAAAAKALAQWTAMKAKNAAKKVAKKISEAEYRQLEMLDGPAVRLDEALMRELEESLQALLLEEARHNLNCPKCDHTNPADAEKCARCGHDLSEARKAKFAKLDEAGWAPGLHPRDFHGQWIATVSTLQDRHSSEKMSYSGRKGGVERRQKFANAKALLRVGDTSRAAKYLRLAGYPDLARRLEAGRTPTGAHLAEAKNDEPPVVPAGPKKGIRAPAKQDEPGSSAEVESSGDRVAHLQRRLSSLGFELNPDGHFGPATSQAVKAFQAHSMIKEDGVVGPATTAALKAAPHPDEMVDAGGAEGVSPDDPESGTHQDYPTAADPHDGVQVNKPKGAPTLYKGLAVGEKSGDKNVRNLQADLGRMGYSMQTDGVFGPETEKTVKKFQRKYGLKPDGIVGEKTHRVMTQVSAKQQRLEEAVERRRSASGSDFARAFAVEQMLRQQLEEGFNPAVFVADTLQRIPEAAYAVAAALAPGDIAYGEIEEGKLSSKERDALPDSAFAIPERRAYPVHDEGHCKAALSRVAQHGTASEKARVKAAVRKRHPKMLQEVALVLEEANKGLDSLIAALVEKGIPENEAKAIAAKHIGSGGGGAQRGEKAGGKVTTLKRMPNGMFAPKGQGEVLKAGQQVSVPHTAHEDDSSKNVTGKVTNVDKIGSAHVTLDDGPDAGKPFQVGAKQAPWMDKTGQTAPGEEDDLPSLYQQLADAEKNAAFEVTNAGLASADKVVDELGAKILAAQGGKPINRDAKSGVPTAPTEPLAGDAEKKAQPWAGPEVGSKIKDKSGNEGEVTAHHDHSSGESDKKKFSVKHSGGEAKVSMGQLGDVLAGKKEWPAGKAKPKASKPKSHNVGDVAGWSAAAQLSKSGSGGGGDLAGSPGRGPTGKLRNFKAMSPAKLKKTIADLESFGGDPEALSAVKAVAKEKGVAWAEPSKSAPKGTPIKTKYSPDLGGLQQEVADKSAAQASAAGVKPLAQSPTPSPQEEMGAAGAMGPNTGDLQLKDMPIGTTFQMNDGTEFVLHKPVNDPFMIAKPTQGGKAKPFHKMMAPPQVGPVHPDYGGDPSHVASSPPADAPSAGVSAHALSDAPNTADLESLLSASVDKAKAAKAAGQNPADAFKTPPEAAPAPSAAAGAAESAALAAYKAAGGNDPAIIAALSKQK
jgi:peptidoglycan hydrolase-like protein with peptidoglycan-binding domain/ssDNA-binding Zn-finger/Zn-ribbon topoisomerase 1